MSANDRSRSEPLRVLHCFRAPVGGLFRHVCDQVRYQHARKFDVGVVCAVETGGDNAARALDELAACCTLGMHRIPLRRTVGLLDFVSYRRLLALGRGMRPDILHGHGAKGGALARLIAARVATRVVYTPHGGALHYESTSMRGRFYLWIERLLKNRSDGIIFESQYAQQAYREKVGEPGCPSRLIVNGVADDEFEPLAEDDADYDFVFVGELRRLKGLRTLLDALSLLRQRGAFRLLIVGDGPQHDRCRLAIQRAGLTDCVDMLPAMRPGRAAIARGRCLVVPSLNESCPYIVLEAAAAGRPIIASNAGGIPEIFGDQSDRLVETGNPAALACAMEGFLGDYESARRSAATLCQRVRSGFSTDTMGIATTEFYRQLVCTKSVELRHA